MTTGAKKIREVFTLLGGPAVLLPIKPGVKRPEIKAWTELSLEDMDDPGYIGRFNNGCNIGVALGRQSGGLCTIDIDDDRFVEEFLNANPGLRTTLRTKRLKGCNFWLWVEGEYPPVAPFHHARLLNAKGKPQAIGEWRSTGAQTVISGQAEGVEYQCLINAPPVRMAFSDLIWPDWIANPPMLDLSHEAKTGLSLDLAKLENVVEHKNGAYHAACPACREAGEDAHGNHLFIRPDGRFGCCKYVQDRAHRKAVWRLAGKPEETRTGSDYILGIGDPFYELSQSKGPDLPEIVDAAEFAAKDIRRSPEIVKGLIHLGGKVVIGGGSKSFKTWVQLDLAVSVAYGVPWMGFSTLPGRVLFVNFEIQEEFFQDRIKAVVGAKSLGLEKGRFDVWNLRGKSASYDLIVPKIIARIRDEGYVLCIMDPVYKLYGKTDENNASDVAALLNCFEGMTVDTRSTVAFGAHYSKGNQAAKEAIDRVSGSGVFSRDPDSIINFTRHEEENAFTVEPILRNLPPVEPFVVRWQYPLMVLDDSLDPDCLKQPCGGGRSKEYSLVDMLSVIRDCTETNPISVSEWVNRCHVPKATLHRYLPEMRIKGYLKTIGEGRSARQCITPNGLSILPRE